MVAEVSPELRVRFSTSHPKDMTDEVLEVMAAYDNICKYIHLPFQSGSNEVLERMNRGYTRGMVSRWKEFGPYKRSFQIVPSQPILLLVSAGRQKRIIRIHWT